MERSKRLLQLQHGYAPRVWCVHACVRACGRVVWRACVRGCLDTQPAHHIHIHDTGVSPYSTSPSLLRKKTVQVYRNEPSGGSCLPLSSARDHPCSARTHITRAMGGLEHV